MSKNMRHRRILLQVPLILSLLIGCLFLNLPTRAFGFSFAVMSDPHGASDSWKNTLTEVRDMTVNPEPKFSKTVFLLVTGDTNPIDLRFKDYTEVFKNTSPMPTFLTVIGNHEFDDSGGMPGGMPAGMGMPPEGQKSPPMMPPQGSEKQPSASKAPETAGRGPSPNGVIQAPGNPPGMYPNNGDPNIIDIDFIKEKIISAIPGVVRMNENSCSYYYDYQNVRIICLDGYSGDTGKQGIINDTGRKWTESVIKSAPENIDHIFVAFHAPAFPRVRHTHDSFNADPTQRNAFWNMLMAHRDRVRAVFCGHTHYYNRMRVSDPADGPANDFTVTPDEPGGIYQVNAGSTGNGNKNTFVRVEIDGKNIVFRAYEAENGKAQPFSVLDEWRIDGGK